MLTPALGTTGVTRRASLPPSLFRLGKGVIWVSTDSCQGHPGEDAQELEGLDRFGLDDVPRRARPEREALRARRGREAPRRTQCRTPCREANPSVPKVRLMTAPVL